MRRAIKIGLLLALVFVAGVAAALTVVFTGPATYADSQWKSICISNKNGGTVYTGIIEVCPSSNTPGENAACSTYTKSVATLPSNYQTFVDGWITYWRTAHPGY